MPTMMAKESDLIDCHDARAIAGTVASKELLSGKLRCLGRSGFSQSKPRGGFAVP